MAGVARDALRQRLFGLGYVAVQLRGCGRSGTASPFDIVIAVRLAVVGEWSYMVVHDRYRLFLDTNNAPLAPTQLHTVDHP
jgi:hypothetical protein